MIAGTTLLVDLLRRDPGARAKVERLERGTDVLWVLTPVLFELWEGVERSRKPLQEMERVQRVLEGYTLLALDPRHAVRAGRISGDLIRRGTMLDSIDAMIAGMAVEERQAVVTRNVKDFSRVPDLQVVTY